MKQLLIIRHAKSSWDNAFMSDFDRPLNERGLRDAPMMAARLMQQKVEVDALVSSPANRALSTARLFAKAWGIPEKQIVQIPALYHAPAPVFYDVIANELKSAWKTVAIFSHNPGITYFVNDLQVAKVDNMPTCGVFGVAALTQNWAQFAEAEKRFWFFDYPKKM